MARVIRITAACLIGLIAQAAILATLACILPSMGIKNDALLDFTKANVSW